MTCVVCWHAVGTDISRGLDGSWWGASHVVKWKETQCHRLEPRAGDWPIFFLSKDVGPPRLFLMLTSFVTGKKV